jgi:HD-GYP domain-containing protein (c-di-GMP phosphodiesterase class II)
VDVFDALTSQRPYKKAYSYAESINILRKGSGSHFDPELLHVFDHECFWQLECNLQAVQ